MAKQSISTNKKILWDSAGVLLTSGFMVAILVPVLTSKDDAKKNTKLTLNYSDEIFTARQKLYGLEIKEN